jgi:hypothetical protein
MPAFKVEFGGVDVTSYIKSCEVKDYYKNRMTVATIKVASTVNTAVTLSSNTTVEVWRSLTAGSITDPTDKIFDGYVEIHELQHGVIKIEAYDKLVLTKRKRLNKIYFDSDPEAGKISEIFKDIVEDQVTGLTTTVTDSGTTFVLEKFKCLRTDAFERLRKLAEMLKWQFYYEPVTAKVIFEPEGNTINANSLTVGTEIAGKLVWEQDKTELANNITVKGGSQSVRTTETFNGDASTATFTLSRKPIDIYITVGGTVQTISLENTSSADVFVDKESKTITFDSGSIPGVGVGNIVVDYSYWRPIIYSESHPTSIVLYDESQAEFEYTDITSLNDAITRTQKLLEVYSEPFISTDLRLPTARISTYGLAVGQQVQVIDSENSIDGYYLVMEYIYRYPYGYDIVKVGNRELRLDEVQFDTLDRIKRLEEQSLSDQDIAFQGVNIGEDTTEKITELEILLGLVNDSFILSNDEHGVLTVHEVIDTHDSTAGNWSSSDFLLSNEGSTVKVGSGSLKIDMNSNTTGTLSSTTPLGDLSSYTGASSGSPSQGIIGLWLYKPSGVTISAINLRIGSGASDYSEIGYKRFADHVGYGSITDWENDAWQYIVFDLDGGSVATVGTPDWTAVDYRRIEITTDSSAIFYIDLCGISENTMAPNFLGDRRTEESVETLTY